MSHKSLSEAAAEVLQKSRGAHAAAMAVLDKSGIPGNGLVDVGGSTIENPEARDMGHKAAAGIAQATTPGVAPASDTNEPMKTLNNPNAAASNSGRPLVSPSDINGVQQHEYMKPVTGPNSVTTEETETDESVELTPEELEEAKKEKIEKMKAKMKAKSVKEDIDAILSGETFSEDFKTKLSTIFEAAVISRAVEVVEEMEEDILAAAEQSVADVHSEIEANVDTYLTAMVAEWKEENKVAIESGLKSEIMEDFLSGLKTLFEENYIDLPSEKVDVVESLTAEVSELTEKLNKSMNSNVDLVKAVNEATKKAVTNTVCEGLTATQAEKIKTLAEGVEFVTADDYTKKLKVIREGYTSTVKTTPAATQVALVESSGEQPPSDTPVAPALDDRMAAYVKVLNRTAG